MTLRRLASGEVYGAAELADGERVRPAPALPVRRPLRLVDAPPVPWQDARPPRTDRELLEALGRVKARLYPREREAFGRMLAEMRAGRFRALSFRQRAWGQEVGARVGIPGVEAPWEWRDFG
jgi:hypothetical protein